ncbi:hypothetical protein TVAG_246070 [Trichomonas vaginalis G3]|uniref:Uncharacterized protein n=1 Tax=Trichomonas vaginalis (strain ATCC PRA-98 / G3) TaxID=412133 RepID=A2E4R5_TRIV3|nr:armadillo (ARM) repeat-containing protein family [Trichomonas vaginalis G3]EAY12375.1 hypothetical protein TVAG_246070 [Trichomonas vaginalis G3]KAI5500793.1 armadillo (ARM) repeat-containing protein family [Trichomonas vaginalis G3]|eukprot:XP_001324598.1 hypothetical protein [Trichomonas vaginalis G3]
MKASEIKKIDDILKRAQKDNVTAVSGTLQELMSFSGEYGSYIIQNGLPFFLKLLSKKGLPGDINPTVIMLLSQIVKNDEKSAFILFKNPQFLPTILSLLETGDNELMLMTQKLLIIDPIEIITFIQNQIKILTPLVDCVCRGGNKEASKLLIMLAGAPTLCQLVLPIIIPNKHRFPIPDLINLIISNSNLKDMTPLTEFASIILHHPSINQLDFKDSLISYPDAWSDISILKILNHFKPSDKAEDAELHEFVKFICEQPAQSFDVSETDVLLFSNSLLNPTTKIPENNLHKSVFYFIRFYVLSFCNPELVTQEAKDFIYSNLTFDSNYSTLGAVQCIIYWSFHFKCLVPVDTVYKIAALFYSNPDSKEESNLIRASIRTLSDSINSAATIQLFDEELRFSEEELAEFANSRPSWLFPHVLMMLGDVLKQPIYDATIHLDVLGELNKFFGLSSPLEIKSS